MSERDVPTLRLSRGSANSIEVSLSDERDEPEDLTGCDDAVFTVRDAIDPDTASFEVVATVGDGLEIDVEGSKLIVSLTQEQADLLPVGVLVADVAVQIGGSWFYSEVFNVEVSEQLTVHP